MTKLKRAQQGFTLLELVIVVAIIGFLAMTAIPVSSAAVHQTKTVLDSDLAGDLTTPVIAHHGVFLTAAPAREAFTLATAGLILTLTSAQVADGKDIAQAMGTDMNSVRANIAAERFINPQPAQDATKVLDPTDVRTLAGGYDFIKFSQIKSARTPLAEQPTMAQHQPSGATTFAIGKSLADSTQPPTKSLTAFIDKEEGAGQHGRTSMDMTVKEKGKLNASAWTKKTQAGATPPLIELGGGTGTGG